MRLVFFLSCIFLLVGCSKPKTVLICGDHICVNKTEAEQYFQENLSLEVKIIDKKEKRSVDLVELNLKQNSNGKRKIDIFSKNKTDENIKILSKKEKDEIKKNIQNKKKEKKFAKRINKRNKKLKNEYATKSNKNFKKNVYKKNNNIVDVCTILDICCIDEISEYLLKQGKKKNYPDITTRQ